MKILTKGGYMKKKLLVLLIAAIPMLMPNLVLAIAVEAVEPAVYANPQTQLIEQENEWLWWCDNTVAEK